MRSKFKTLVIILICAIISFCTIVSSISVQAKETEDYKTLLQTDGRWSGLSLGGGGYTIGQAGCAVTSVTMMMAYANPELRDINEFNPGTTVNILAPGGLLHWGNTGQLDKTFTLVANINGVSDPLKTVTENMDKGYYVIIYSPRLVDTSISPNTTQHYSPIVGMKDGKPQVWDVGVGLYNNWDTWVKCGITQIVVYKSSISSSKDSLSGNTTSTPEGDELEEKKQEWNKLVEEQDLVGMGDDFKFEADVSLPGYDSLNYVEKDSLSNIKENILEEKGSWFDKVRVLVSFIGLAVVIYGVLLGVAYLFDKVNTILDISLLGILTLGRYKLWDETLGIEPGVSNGTMYCNNRIIIGRIFIIECVGFLLVSDLIFKLLYELLIKVSII